MDRIFNADRGINFEKEYELSEQKYWFDCFYRPQIEQAQRAQRTGAEWHAVDGSGRTYTTIAELDAEANNKQEQIRALKAQLQEV